MLDCSVMDESHNASSSNGLVLVQLPGELLELIINAVHLNGRQSVSSLVPLSHTCKVIRSICMPLIFKNRCIRLHRGHVDKLSREFLELVLDPMSKLAEHILHMNINDSADAYSASDVEVVRELEQQQCTLSMSRCNSMELVRKALSVMTRLQTVRYVQVLFP